MFGNISMLCTMVPLLCELLGMVNKINKFVMFLYSYRNQQGTYNIYKIRHKSAKCVNIILHRTLCLLEYSSSGAI